MKLSDEDKVGASVVLEAASRALNVPPDTLFLVIGRVPDLNALAVGHWPGVEMYEDIGPMRVVVGRAGRFREQALSGPPAVRRIAEAMAPENNVVPVITMDATSYTITRVRVRLAMLTEGGKA